MGKSLLELHRGKREIALAIARASGKTNESKRRIYMESLACMGVETNTAQEGLQGSDARRHPLFDR